MNRTRKAIISAAALGSVLSGGAGLLAFGSAANAADSTTSAPAASTGTSARGSETALTGDDLAKATAAAATAAPGSTVVRAETDADGDAYEVHITQADGTRATVKLDSDFTVRTVEADQGKGGGGGPHQANGITETALTGDDLAKATAAAATAEPGSTVVRAETDADGDAFEVHVTLADGTRATVKLAQDFSVTKVETDQAMGGKGGHGHGPAAAPDASASTSTTTA